MVLFKRRTEMEKEGKNELKGMYAIQRNRHVHEVVKDKAMER
jgi:hypothetical protein